MSMWMRAFVRVVLCGMLFALLPLSARAADVDLPTYLQHLTAARDALTQAQPLAGPPRDAAIQRARDALTGVDGVTVGTTRYPAQHAEILTTLGRTPPDLDRALGELNTLIAPLAEEQSARPDPRAREKLDTVLSDRAFREARPNIIQKQAIRFRDWLGEQLRRLFRPLDRLQPKDVPRGTPGAGFFAKLLALLGDPRTLIALAVVIALVIALIILRRRGMRMKRAAADAAPVPRTAAEWQLHAEMLAGRGEYRAAVRALFLGTLTDLDERRLITYDPALTDREYLREAQRQQWWLVEPLRPFVRLVEAIVYAEAPCRAAEYERARACTDAVRQRVTAPQGAPS